MTLQLGHFTDDSQDPGQVEAELASASSAVKAVSNIIDGARVDGVSRHVLDKWRATLDELESRLRGAINRHAYKSAKEAVAASGAGVYQSSFNAAAQAIQEAELAELGISIDGIQSLASAVNKEVYGQKDMLTNLDEKLGANASLVDSLADRMSGFLRTKDPALIRLVFYLACLSSLLVFVLLLL